MKFVMAMIYALTAALLLGLFGIFVYFSVLQQQSAGALDGTAANLALLLFVTAVLTFTLILIRMENQTDKNPPLIVKETPPVRISPPPAPVADNRQAENIENIMQRLNQISASLALTNKTLNLGLECLNARIDKVENASIDKVIHQQTTELQEEQTEPQTSENEQKLSAIFNDELAQTLSGLEIMQDSDFSPTGLSQTDEIDLETLLNNTKSE